LTARDRVDFTHAITGVAKTAPAINAKTDSCVT
jgi:hypothetical protein